VVDVGDDAEVAQARLGNRFTQSGLRSPVLGCYRTCRS
jgi:hypothetical protein